MANNREPKVRLHKASGIWILAIEGKTHYLSKSLEEAEQLALPLLDTWRAKTGRGQVYADGQSPASEPAQIPPNGPVLVSQAAQRLQKWVRTEMGDNAAEAVNLKLKAFLAKFGTRQIGKLSETELEEWRESVVGKYPKTSLNQKG